MTPDLTEQIMEVKRELAMRERLYPYLVQNDRLNQPEATKRLERMRAVLQTLKELRDKGTTLFTYDANEQGTPDSDSQGSVG